MEKLRLYPFLFIFIFTSCQWNLPMLESICSSHEKISFEMPFDIGNQDIGHSLIQNSKGNFFLLGTAQNGDGGSIDYQKAYLRVVDSTGEFKWDKLYDYKGQSLSKTTGNNIIEANDGNVIILGNVKLEGKSDYDIFLSKIDVNTQLPIWEMTFEFSQNGNEHGNHFVKVSNSNELIIIGRIEFEPVAPNCGNCQTVLFRVDTDSGNELDSRIIPNRLGGSIHETSNNEYTFIGYKKADGREDLDIDLITVDKNFNIIQEAQYGTSMNNEWGNTLLKRANGSLILVGYSQEFGNSQVDPVVQLIEVNGENAASWHPYPIGHVTRSIVEVSNGRYVLGGHGRDPLSQNLVALLFEARLGTSVEAWEKSYAGSPNAVGNAMIRTADNCFAMFGYKHRSDTERDFYFVKIGEL